MKWLHLLMALLQREGAARGLAKRELDDFPQPVVFCEFAVERGVH